MGDTERNRFCYTVVSVTCSGLRSEVLRSTWRWERRKPWVWIGVHLVGLNRMTFSSLVRLLLVLSRSRVVSMDPLKVDTTRFGLSLVWFTGWPVSGLVVGCLNTLFTNYRFNDSKFTNVSSSINYVMFPRHYWRSVVLLSLPTQNTSTGYSYTEGPCSCLFVSGSDSQPFQWHRLPD